MTTHNTNIKGKLIKEKEGWKKPLVEIKPKESIELTAKTAKKASNVNIASGQGEIDPNLAAIINQYSR